VQVAWLRVATFFNFFAFLPVDCLDFGSSGMVNRAHALASPSRRTTQACAQQGFLHAQPRSWGVISAPSGVAPAIGTNFEGVVGPTGAGAKLSHTLWAVACGFFRVAQTAAAASHVLQLRTGTGTLVEFHQILQKH
jgi:hypothetical protein